MRLLELSYQTFKKRVRNGRVHVVRLSSGRLRVPYSEVERILGKKSEEREVRAVIYARVSSSDLGQSIRAGLKGRARDSPQNLNIYLRDNCYWFLYCIFT